jgi:hypothetical protein
LPFSLAENLGSMSISTRHRSTRTYVSHLEHAALRPAVSHGQANDDDRSAESARTWLGASDLTSSFALVGDAT